MNLNLQSRNRNHLFDFQLRTFPILLAWSIGSVAAGLFWWLKGDRWLRGFGMQFVGWGLIDGLIALFALRGAVDKSTQLESGYISPSEHARQARSFKKIVLANAFLDIGYMLGGRWLIQRFPHDQQKQGMGWAIIIQGGFLMVWDVFLALLSPGEPDAS